MLANEPCAEDNIPKNRQNNVYGHGHVNSIPSVMEAANKVYELSLTLNVTLINEMGEDNRVHLTQGEEVEFNVEGGATRVQWRTWDMRDNWMDLADFDVNELTFAVTHSLLVDRLQYLPNNTVEGNQVLLVRAITEDRASTNLAVDITVIGEEKIEKSSSSGSSNMALITGLLSVLVIILFVALTVATMKLKESGVFSDEQIEEEMEDWIENLETKIDDENSG